MIVLNLTPHAVKIVKDGETVATFPPSGEIARVSTRDERIGFIGVEGGLVPTVRQTYGETTGLPAEVPGTILIVSGLVRAANPGRPDLASPGGLARNAEGQVIGCEFLILN